jgi:hypothetical protein
MGQYRAFEERLEHVQKHYGRANQRTHQQGTSYNFRQYSTNSDKLSEYCFPLGCEAGYKTHVP